MITDLFGQPVPEPPPRPPGARSDAERRREQRRLSERAKGYAARPGSGPVGETCRTCAHAKHIAYHRRTYIKCGANRAAWTHSVRTDIRLKSPACKKWEAQRDGP